MSNMSPSLHHTNSLYLVLFLPIHLVAGVSVESAGSSTEAVALGSVLATVACLGVVVSVARWASGLPCSREPRSAPNTGCCPGACYKLLWNSWMNLLENSV